MKKLTVKQKRSNKISKARDNLICPFKGMSRQAPSYITPCPKCSKRLPSSMLARWDNELAKQWVSTKSVLERFDKWHGVSVCDECYSGILKVLKKHREDYKGYTIYSLRNNYDRRMIK